jgi:hypothetical protein
MSAAQATLPGLFATSAQSALVASMSPDEAIGFVACSIMSVAQACGCDPVANTVDIRFRSAMSQAVGLSLALDDRARKLASDRCAFLTKHLRDRGAGGIAGKLARAAYLLGRAAQAVEETAHMTEALALLEEAIVLHAIIHQQDVAVARARHQLGILNRAQPSRRLH